MGHIPVPTTTGLVAAQLAAQQPFGFTSFQETDLEKTGLRHGSDVRSDGHAARWMVIRIGHLAIPMLKARC